MVLPDKKLFNLSMSAGPVGSVGSVDSISSDCDVSSVVSQFGFVVSADSVGNDG